MLGFADGAPQQQPICAAVCTAEQTPLGGEGECLESQVEVSDRDLGMPLMIFSLPGSALALLQPSRITAFLRAQQPASVPGGNRFFQQEGADFFSSKTKETARIPVPSYPFLFLWP